MHQKITRSEVPSKRTGIRGSVSVYVRAGVIAMVASGLALSGTAVAQAASYTYASNKSASQNQTFDSGNRASISGGYAATEPFSADGAQAIVTLDTYRPAPGYQSISFNTGGGSVSVIHAATTNVHQKCFWYWPYSGANIGNLDLTCRANG
jgi:hypothetical protein